MEFFYLSVGRRPTNNPPGAPPVKFSNFFSKSHKWAKNVNKKSQIFRKNDKLCKIFQNSLYLINLGAKSQISINFLPKNTKRTKKSLDLVEIVKWIWEK